MFADMLLKELREELVRFSTVDVEDVTAAVVDGFRDRLRGASPLESSVPTLFPYEHTEIPEGLPLVAGSFITSTRSVGETGGFMSQS